MMSNVTFVEMFALFINEIRPSLYHIFFFQYLLEVFNLIVVAYPFFITSGRDYIQTTMHDR